MFKPLPIVIATGAAVLGTGSIAGGAPTSPRRPSKPAVVAVLGRWVAVPPGQFRKAYAFCPRGYHVTGGGAYSGAITEIASSPTPNLRGWFVDGTNSGPAHQTFHHRADAVCALGNPPATAAITADESGLRQLELEFAAGR